MRHFTCPAQWSLVAGRLRALRLEAGLTQAELALALGIREDRVRSLERGLLPLCGREFDYYQQRFGVPCSYLFGR